VEIDLAPGKIAKLQLARAEPATGIVVSKALGEAVPTAELWLVHRRGPRRFSTTREPRSGGQPAAFADSEGRFSLLSLRDDCAHTFLVYAVGYAPVFLEDVRPGQRDLRVELGPELYVRGRIIAPEELPAAPRPIIGYSQPFVTEDGSHSWQHMAPVTIEEGVGHFEIRELRAGLLRIIAGDEHVKLDVTAPVDDLVIDLTPHEDTETAEEVKRRVEMRFAVPEGAPPAQGNATINFYTGAGDNRIRYHLSDRKMPVVDGVIGFEVPVPGDLRWASMAIPGYAAVGYPHAKVLAGEGPFVIDVECVPAGAIYGRVFEADGSSAKLVGPDNALVSIVTVEKPASMEQGGQTVQVESQPDGKYMATPLPLGGCYAVVAHRGASYAMGEPIWLDDAIPLCDVDVHLVEGVPIEVQVLEPDGKPAVGVPLSIHYDTPYSHGFGGSDQDTDRFGRFVFEHVNPDAPGTYHLRMKSRLKYRPVRLPLDVKGGPVTVQLELGKVVTGGVVEDATGQPPEGIEVYAIHYEGAHSESLEMEGAKTGKDGAFRFSNMAAIEYQLGIRGGQEVGEYKATGGQSEPVEIRIKRRPRSP
jgi:hypothetical protein